MKKHLVMICGFHYPYSSPTATCAERYVSLFKDEYEIEIISYSEDGKEYHIISESGYKISVLTNFRLRLEGKLNGLAKKTVHTIASSQLYFSRLGNQSWFANAVADTLDSIHRDKAIDVVFSVCSPLAAHVGTASFCERYPDIRSVAYTVDPYSTSDRIKPIWLSVEDLVSFECNTLNSFNRVLLSEEVYDNRIDIRSCLHDCKPLPYMLPSFIDYSSVEGRFSKDGIHCVYAGSFYAEIRNPKYMLQVFSLLEKYNITLHVYSKGCEDIVNEYCKAKNIVQHGLVNPTELPDVYAKSDALIGIGNSMKEFLPSKTFEYVATQKPIIYFNYPTIGNPVLANYPKAIQIEMSEDVSKSSSLLKDFLESLDGQLVSKEQILYSYSKYSPANIKKILKYSFES